MDNNLSLNNPVMFVLPVKLLCDNFSHTSLIHFVFVSYKVRVLVQAAHFVSKPSQEDGERGERVPRQGLFENGWCVEKVWQNKLAGGFEPLHDHHVLCVIYYCTHIEEYQRFGLGLVPLLYKYSIRILGSAQKQINSICGIFSSGVTHVLTST